MIIIKRFFIAMLLSALAAPALYAQVGAMDEIVVTATRLAVESPPSVYYTRKGDFLLLEVNIESDARDLAERLTELEETIDEFVAAAKKDEDISLSFIDEGDFVRPLTSVVYEDAIGFGSRPDTSVARVQVKTPIPDDVADAFGLSRKLVTFVDDMEETGRVTISNNGEVTISVVNPAQYRKDVVKIITDDVNAVTGALGPEYRVILEGLDQPMESFRSGDLSLSFYLPYEYIVIPDTLHSFRLELPEDY
ncbi:hypothetical protein ACJ3XI_06510 [Litorimonas sp. RW-G-Af-16]|uniref:hypothetical protein n=1 Tax=Litorimonas sp. RW-G-Af-16 TaxID=3241168 RepID=UPI00390C4132